MCTTRGERRLIEEICVLTRISSKNEIMINENAQRQPTISVVEQGKNTLPESNQGPLGLDSCTKPLHYVKDTVNLLIIITGRAFGSIRQL